MPDVRSSLTGQSNRFQPIPEWLEMRILDCHLPELNVALERLAKAGPGIRHLPKSTVVTGEVEMINGGFRIALNGCEQDSLRLLQESCAKRCIGIIDDRLDVR